MQGRLVAREYDQILPVAEKRPGFRSSNADPADPYYLPGSRSVSKVGLDLEQLIRIRIHQTIEKEIRPN